MRWSQPDEHLPGSWTPESEAEADELESREHRRGAPVDDEEDGEPA